MLTPAFYQIKERSLRDLIGDIYNLIKSIIISIYNFFVWAYNKILDTELSIYWKIFWWCIGIIFFLGLILTVYAKVKNYKDTRKQLPLNLSKNLNPQRIWIDLLLYLVGNAIRVFQ